mmetsp:Transcript_26224/g.59474  ORF Transcript_26224/g.59474 Transcript_26224/m.59474 type:complete len:209 (-) Transcript_26224:101-727(-)
MLWTLRGGRLLDIPSCNLTTALFAMVAPSLCDGTATAFMGTTLCSPPVASGQELILTDVRTAATTHPSPPAAASPLSLPAPPMPTPARSAPAQTSTICPLAASRSTSTTASPAAMPVGPTPACGRGGTTGTARRFSSACPLPSCLPSLPPQGSSSSSSSATSTTSSSSPRPPTSPPTSPPASTRGATRPCTAYGRRSCSRPAGTATVW